MEGLEEQSPPPRPKRRWRHWLLPVVFTVLLYAGLGLAFYDKKQPTQPLPAESNEQATVVAVVSDDVPPIQEFEVGGSVAVPELPTKETVFVQQPSSVNLTPVATTPQATRKIYHNQPAPPPRMPEVEPLPVEENLPPSPPKSEPSLEAQALTKAEEEAEAQNELLREAINKVKELNDGKIAKARENNIIEESPPPVVAKVEKVEVAEEKKPSKEETQVSDDIENE